MTVLDEDTEFLEHFGVKGQKWGVRRGKSKTGVSRARGATIDRNDRMIANINASKAGTKYKVSTKAVAAVIGKERQTANQNNMIRDLKAQNKRLKTGELHVADRLKVIGGTSLFDLGISRRPA